MVCTGAYRSIVKRKIYIYIKKIIESFYVDKYYINDKIVVFLHFIVIVFVVVIFFHALSFLQTLALEMFAISHIHT